MSLGFINHVWVLGMCLCCSGVCEDWVGAGTRVWRGGVMSVWIVSPDSLCRWQVQVSVYCGYLHILGAPSVQPCCTLPISSSYYVFVYGRYSKSRFVCVWLSEQDLSRHHQLLWGAAPAIKKKVSNCRVVEWPPMKPNCFFERRLLQHRWSRIASLTTDSRQLKWAALGGLPGCTHSVNFG